MSVNVCVFCIPKFRLQAGLVSCLEPNKDAVVDSSRYIYACLHARDQPIGCKYRCKGQFIVATGTRSYILSKSKDYCIQAQKTWMQHIH